MAKKPVAIVKLQIPAGKASPAPPVGPALGQQGLNIMEFCNTFNQRTKDQEGMIIPVVISVYQDKTFDFITKTPPAAVLLKRAAGLAKASGRPNTEKVGRVSEKQVEEIAQVKMKDLNANDIEAAKRMVEGTARSMGILVGEGGEITVKAEAPPTAADAQTAEGQASPEKETAAPAGKKGE